MSSQPKTSLKLPIFLMVGPALGLILGVFLYAVVNFVLSGYVSESSPTSITDGASIAQGADGEELFAEDDGTGLFRTISNVLLFLLGSISVLAFIPCLIFGIILLNKRRNARDEVASAQVATESRNWEDVQ